MMNLPKLSLVPAVVLLSTATAVWAEVRSSLYPANWAPGYADASGRFLHDFSYAGYHKGEDPIPHVTANIVDASAAPYYADSTGVNDATAAIQLALDTVGQAGGGVVYLPAGTYKVKPQGGNAWCLRIQYNNVVLRGAGMGQTHLYCDETFMRGKAVVLLRPSTDVWWYGGTNATLVTQDLMAPTRVIPVASVSGYAVGDFVVLRTELTQAFINEHGMQAHWPAYHTGIRGVTLVRRILSIDPAAGTLTLDAPTRYWMKTRDEAKVCKLNDANLRESGVEKISIGMKENTGPGSGANGIWEGNDYNTAGMGAYDVSLSSAVTALYCEDCWILQVGSYRPAGNANDYHLMANGIVLNYCRQVTVDGCDMRQPKCLRVGGGNGYLYELASNECLVTNCYAYKGRHNYDLQGMRCIGNVLHSNTAELGYLVSDYHMYLSTANLHDNMICKMETLEAAYHNGGSPAHGQTSSQCVFWNTRGDAYNWRGYIVFSQQFGNGYVIGTRGAAPAVYTTTDDFLEHVGAGDSLEPPSLWLDQLARRTGTSSPGALITSVSVTSSQNYPIATGLGVGDKVYLEAWDTGTYSVVPAEVQGATFLQTSRNDHTNTATNFMTLELGQAADLYVAYRANQTKPGWLDGTWADLGINLSTSVGMHMRLHRKNFPQGTVTLGGNAQGGGSSTMMYVVCAKPATGLALTDLSVNGGNPYAVENGLAVGGKVYEEAWDVATYSGVPAEVEGGMFIRTRRNDHTATVNPFLTFTVTQPAKVYVAYRAGQAKPSWLDATWTDTGANLDTSVGMHMRLYRKNFAAGPVSLGGNATGGGSSTMMYVVAVLPQ